MLIFLVNPLPKDIEAAMKYPGGGVHKVLI